MEQNYIMNKTAMLKHLSALPKSIAIGLIIFSFSLPLAAQYTQPEPQVITANVIPVSEPGSYGKAGATYMLTSDISSDRSAVFLGKDVTLDLTVIPLLMPMEIIDTFPIMALKKE